MLETGMILDITHLAEESFWEALSLFPGPVLASHNNCRALVPGDRQFTDEQIHELIRRDAVIGAAFDSWMLYPGWVRGTTPITAVSLENVVDHIDHICQLAGNCRHVAIGSDLDGGFGREQSPHDLDTIADLQKLPAILRRRGYLESDIEGVMYANWARFFDSAWAKN
jgi:membrane dipeptidase